MSLTDEGRRTRAELTKESRTLLAKTAKKLDVQREITRLTRNPAAGMMVRQLLFFDDKKKACDDYWIFKSAKQWEEDEGLTRQQVRTATNKLEEFGLAQVDRDRPDPLYNNKTTFYRLDIYRVMQVVDPVKLAALEPELLYLEPDEATHDEDAPDPTDRDVPEAMPDELDWLPEDFMATDAEQTNNQPLHENQPTPTPKSTNPLVESTNPMYRETTTEELPQKNYEQKNSTLQVGEDRFRGPSPPPDFENQEEQPTTSPPTRTAPPTPPRKEKPTPDAVRALLEPGGSMHSLAETVLAVGGDAYVDSLKKHVADRLGGSARDYHEPVTEVLMDLAKHEQVVA